MTNGKSTIWRLMSVVTADEWKWHGMARPEQRVQEMKVSASIGCQKIISLPRGVNVMIDECN